jgi:hypothetical protein
LETPHFIRLERLIKNNKYSSLFGPFVRNEEKSFAIKAAISIYAKYNRFGVNYGRKSYSIGPGGGNVTNTYFIDSEEETKYARPFLTWITL